MFILLLLAVSMHMQNLDLFVVAGQSFGLHTFHSNYYINDLLKIAKIRAQLNYKAHATNNYKTS